jgi:hypothetical protein
VEVAKAFGEHLLRTGERERGLKVLLEAMLEGRDFVGDATGYFTYGREAVQSRDPETRRLAREALQIFLARSGPRHAAERGFAARLLNSAR